ncbi:MAG TPA: SUMF1/EgtB/PvdO family nonheme iron enzyme, partial [Candidatus Binatia bacterium]
DNDRSHKESLKRHVKKLVHKAKKNDKDRKSADSDLEKMVEMETQQRTDEDAKIMVTVEQEMKDRMTGDEDLKNQLDAETNAREAGDMELKVKMDQEIENRNNTYFHLQDRIQELEAHGTDGSCPPGMVVVGPLCVDKYEASVWSSQDNLATQYGISSSDYPCSLNGNDCRGKIFAMSLPDVTPSRFVTWFQAQQACANAGKRLLTNAEWQMAAAGTPDDGALCNTQLGDVMASGSQAGCVSAWVVHDMVGNLDEWVADWFQDNSRIDSGSMSTEEFGFDGIFGVDEAFPEHHRFPGAMLRGGHFNRDTQAGVFALNVSRGPSDRDAQFGFRCGR